ncbi:MAG: HD domain-containing protein [Rickettsia endosymbiont of Labidopullus appendiculatus]|nr:HD domain-containing protein [Rickettsia endosymbiont of Labidopullus appendiculatus]
MDYLFDTETIIAALLHDVVEDTPSSLQQIEFIFSKRIAEIVCTLSKITNEYQLSKEETFYKINNFHDIERKVIIIKVIDRLHNMRTIHYIKSVEKQKRIANETLQIYIPFASSAHLFEIEHELNSIVLKILNLNP